MSEAKLRKALKAVYEAAHINDYGDWVLDSGFDMNVVHEALDRPSSAVSRGWQPIATAPEATSILLACAGTDIPVYCGRKRRGYYWEPSPDQQVWRCDSSGRFAHPTHWMPIPQKPTKPREMEGV